MKTLDIIFVVLALSFMFIVFLSRISFLNDIYSEKNRFLLRFYSGRLLLKVITEQYPYANGICNLTDYFLSIFNQSNYLLLKNNLGIKVPIEIQAFYINGTKIGDIGGISESFMEFRRVCNYKGNLIIVKVRS